MTSKLNTHRDPTFFTNSMKQKKYEKKLQIFAKLIMNEYESKKNPPHLTIRGFTELTNFQIEMKSELWGDILIKMRVEITHTWKSLKANIDKAILNINELREGKLGRCCVCFEDLKDSKKITKCNVCSEHICGCCADKMKDEEGVHKCPICRADINPCWNGN